MLLVIDVGNTNTVYGVYDKDELIAGWRVATNKNATADEMGMFMLNMLNFENINPQSIENTVISSVVPPIMYSLEHAVRKYLKNKAKVISPKMDFGFNILLDNPLEIGADRLVNAYAAYRLYGGPLIIIDFGTATTFCAVTAAGDYLGGAICPGIKISLDALYTNTAKLPRIEIVTPKNIIGPNTVDAMQSGVLYSYVGGVEYIVKGFKKELGENTKVVATGGLAGMIAANSEVIDTINSHLTLQGLKMIHENIFSKK